MSRGPVGLSVGLTWIELILNLPGARAVGLWEVDGSALVQRGFAAIASMSPEVALAFAEATSRVALDRVELGIVKACIEGRLAVSHVESLPAESGSGYWLRAFEASRSIAVPIEGPGKQTIAVFSVATADTNQDAEDLARHLKEAYSSQER